MTNERTNSSANRLGSQLGSRRHTTLASDVVIWLIDKLDHYWELTYLLPYRQAESGLVEVWCQVTSAYPHIPGYQQIPVPVFTDWWL